MILPRQKGGAATRPARGIDERRSTMQGEITLSAEQLEAIRAELRGLRADLEELLARLPVAEGDDEEK
jgi:hypothetical protein